jgi:hypothetical protein
MLRIHKFLRFCAAVVLGAFDAHAVAERVFLVAAEPLAWETIALALLLQAAAFALPSCGRPPAGLACFRPALMSNV